jgi:hypothetical protein
LQLSGLCGFYQLAQASTSSDKKFVVLLMLGNFMQIFETSQEEALSLAF